MNRHFPLHTSRRELVTVSASWTVAGVATKIAMTEEPRRVVIKGRRKQTVCHWCYRLELCDV